MLLTITSTTDPATDLGYLLHKHPARAHTFDLSFGKAQVFYPEVTEHRCTAALLLEIDPIGLVRGGRGGRGEGGALDQYVNDRPYVASSFLSVAIAEVFGSALAGRSKERPDLPARALPLEARLSVVPCRGGEAFLRRLFEPLDYQVTAHQHVLDDTTDWGPSAYFTVTLAGVRPLSELLTHLYVLVPVLDDDKHYWVGDDEVDKLLRRGQGWLAQHPEREVIARRYLKHRRSLMREALERLMGEEGVATAPAGSARAEEAEIERPISLNEQRLGAVLAAVRQSGAKRVVDLGCGEGQLVRALMGEKHLEEIVGVDVSHRALEVARDRLHLEHLPERQQQRVKLLQGSLMYRDNRLVNFDTATVIEVIEHLEPYRLKAFERSLFEFARPGTVVVTTPNVEYNVKFPNLASGHFRHRDHRFEWSRVEFQAWAAQIATRFRYDVRFVPVGLADATVGPPTQMAVFQR